MNLKEVIGKAIKKIASKKATIATVAAVAGVFTTGYFSAKGAVMVDHEMDPDLDTKLKAKLYAKAYWKAVLSGAVTVGAIVFSDRAHSKKEAMLAGAAIMWKDKFKDFDKRVREKLDPADVDDIYKDMVSDDIMDGDFGAIGNDLTADEFSKILYLYEPISGQCIDTTYERLLETLLDVNLTFQREYVINFDEFLEGIGGETTADTWKLVWDMDDEMQMFNASYCGGFVIDFTEKTNDLIRKYCQSGVYQSPEDRITINFLIEPVEEGEWVEGAGIKRPKVEEVVEKLNLPWDE